MLTRRNMAGCQWLDLRQQRRMFMIGQSEADEARHRMVDQQIVRRGISDERVLKAMRSVPREHFVQGGDEASAYDDAPLPIASGQTISQPFIVAQMLAAAQLRAQDRVLDVGTGSGYGAAVASRLAARVFSIERHSGLAELARERLARLGYDNVEIRVGDGSVGWPEAAPFDAILVAAGSPTVPQALKNQLAIGGRLVIPVGGADRQQLLCITRVSETSFEEDDLGEVMFVPLVGMQGWGEGASTKPLSLPERIAAAAEDLPDFDEDGFGALFDRFGDCRVVLLGEASHGTSEFYQARAAITKRLIERHGFTIVAVEADWPDAAAVNRALHGQQPREGEEMPFRRFPEWMWRNTDVAAFLRWLRGHNETVEEESRSVGFYGLDIYNMGDAIASVLAYLDQVDPEAAGVARERYGCLTPWQRNPAAYGRAVLSSGYSKCEAAVIQQCRDLLARRLDYAGRGDAAFLDAAQSARLVTAAEQYYRTMYYGGAQSWNLRDRHMFETLTHVLDAKGPNAKAVVWAHNSHIGDARYTEMGQSRDELNIGQLCRERFGDQAALIGFGTHTGTVAAATDWDDEMEVKRVRPSHADSVERCFHLAGKSRFLLDLKRDPELSEALMKPRLERFIGVIYRPETELMSHYAEVSLARQFDAYAWFDQTTAVTPLGALDPSGRVPDTYPFGL